MNSHSLNESPIHILDAITSEVGDGNFNPDVALLMIGLQIWVDNMSVYSDVAVNRISKTSAKDSVRACDSIIDALPPVKSNAAISKFTAGNRVKILNDLALIHRKLMQIYNNSNVEYHKDT